MAKSLFASLPHRTSKNAAVGQLQNDECVMGRGNNFFKLSQGNFHEFHEAFSSHSHSKVKIGLLMF